MGFNSRTREGATEELDYYFPRPFVSIHAPVKVRLIPKSLYPYSGVSIHAPVKVRQKKKICRVTCICFNSRTREGATKTLTQRFWRSTSFNSRTREGATPGRTTAVQHQ